MKHITIYSLLLTLVAPAAFAEEVTPANVSSVNGIYQSSLANPSQAAWTMQDQAQATGKGRDDKADQSVGKLNNGSAVAIGTGSALMAKGFPMLASPIPSVQAQGEILIGMGAMEFLQAVKNNDSSDKNAAQRDMLRANAGQNGSGAQVNAQQAFQQALSNPALDSILAQNGINADNFKQQLMNGELQGDALRRALGNKDEISAEDMAKANEAANATFAQVSAEANGKEPGAALAFDESARRNADENSGSSSASVATGAGSVNSIPTGRGSNGELTIASSHSALGNGKSRLRSVAEELGLASAPGSPAFNSLLSQFMKSDPETAVAQMRAVLDAIGIQLPSKTQNIFQRAHRNYRSYGKWRKESRVALK